ncbi:rod shape-determining protein MreD [Tepidibacillus infernus]|uniref:Uncharacterized protein n=1 Tax=Tepidibacillus decaturensis TaxID=1413211 RepID=A0A135L2E0_9BACI|nr:rod shape-determining protein MreD [Tepidibacillus decaturensis]KXG43059.1 hypothetical protein U473_02735 [Tepidibacillus decaturensis]
MGKGWINGLLFLLFLFEGTIFQFLTADRYGSSYGIVPRFVLATIIFISIFKGKTYGLYVGLFFGFLQDIVYGNVIGVYTIGMAAIGYFSGWLIQYFHPSLSIYVLFQLFSQLLFELYLYGMLRLFHLIDISIEWSMLHLMIPSVVVNVAFAILVYKPYFRLIQEKRKDG